VRFLVLSSSESYPSGLEIASVATELLRPPLVDTRGIFRPQGESHNDEMP
jgi:hypothetical protein